MKKRGRFIVLDGIDGTGKATQLKKLVSYLKSQGHNVAQFDFPQYTKPSSYFVKKYLNSRYGNLLQVGPYKASLFYALDRFDVRDQILEALNSGKVVVSNRYVAANMGHQGSRINNPKVRKEFFYWIQHLEFDIFEIPQPDINILLHIPARIAQGLVDQKNKRAYLVNSKRDLHEASLKHLKKAEQTYKELAKMYSHNFTLINCIRKNRLMTPEEVFENIKRVVADVLEFKIKP